MEQTKQYIIPLLARETHNCNFKRGLTELYLHWTTSGAEAQKTKLSGQQLSTCKNFLDEAPIIAAHDKSPKYVIIDLALQSRITCGVGSQRTLSHFSAHNVRFNIQGRSPEKTLPKAQRTQVLSSCHKLLHKSQSNFNFRISIKHQLQYLNQTSTFQLYFNFKILTKPCFRISTQIKLHSLNQSSAEKY